MPIIVGLSADWDDPNIAVIKMTTNALNKIRNLINSSPYFILSAYNAITSLYKYSSMIKCTCFALPVNKLLIRGIQEMVRGDAEWYKVPLSLRLSAKTG